MTLELLACGQAAHARLHAAAYLLLCSGEVCPSVIHPMPEVSAVARRSLLCSCGMGLQGGCGLLLVARSRGQQQACFVAYAGQCWADAIICRRIAWHTVFLCWHSFCVSCCCGGLSASALFRQSVGFWSQLWVVACPCHVTCA